MLKVKNLVKIYKPKKGQAVTALNDVTVDFSDVGLVFLLGKSGSGKSTLLNLLGGLDTYTSGDIVIRGKSTKDFKQSNFDSYRNTFIGFIFQEFNILEEFSVGKNIGLALELQHKLGDRKAVENLLTQVDLEGYYDRKPNELSGGQKQRVAIARALIKNPEIVMADEPTGALDSNTGKQVFDTLKKLAKYKLVIVVSHDRENAEIYGDRIIELADGKIISDRVRSITTNNLVEQKITVIDDKLVKIKAGSALDAAEIVELNKILTNSKEDVYLSLDTKANEEFSKKAVLSGGASTFNATKQEDIKAKTYNASEFKLTKSKLPGKDSFKMALSGLSHKKFRLAFTIFLSFITFAMAGFSTAASLFDAVKTERETLRQVGANQILMAMQSGQESPLGNYFNDQYARGLTVSEIAEIERISGQKAIRLYQPQEQFNPSFFSLYENYGIKNNELTTVYYPESIKNFMIVNNAEDAGITKIGENSRLPKNASEIALTDYLVDGFIEYGYKLKVDGKPTISVKIEKAEDMIGKQIGPSASLLTVVGVYKTSIDKEQFAKYKEISTSNMIASLTFDPSHLIMGMGIVSEDYNNGNSPLGEDFSSNRIFNIRSTDANGAGGTEYCRIKYYERCLSADKSQYVMSGSRETLANNEIIINIKLAKEMLKEPNNNLNDTQWAKAIMAYPKEERKIRYGFSNSESGIINWEDAEVVGINFYSDRTIVCLGENRLNEEQKREKELQGININGYGIDLKGTAGLEAQGLYSFKKFSVASLESKQEIYWGKTNGVANAPKTTLAENEIIVDSQIFSKNNGGGGTLSPEEVKAKFDEITKQGLFGKISYDSKGNQTVGSGKEVVVVGIFTAAYNQTLIADSFYAQLKDSIQAPKKIIVTLPTSEIKRAELFKYFDSIRTKEGTEVSRIKVCSHISPLMEFATSLIEPLKTVFMYVSILFSVFAALLLMNFIGVSISYKKKEIGVLRAIGARSTDVFKIFFAESAVIAAMNLILASISLVVVSVLLNRLLQVTVFTFNLLPYLLMAVLSFGIAFIATYIPTKKIAHKKPIDAINNK